MTPARRGGPGWWLRRAPGASARERAMSTSHRPPRATVEAGRVRIAGPQPPRWHPMGGGGPRHPSSSPCGSLGIVVPLLGALEPQASGEADTSIRVVVVDDANDVPSPRGSRAGVQAPRARGRPPRPQRRSRGVAEHRLRAGRHPWSPSSTPTWSPAPDWLEQLTGDRVGGGPAGRDRGPDGRRRRRSPPRRSPATEAVPPEQRVAVT